MISLHRSMHSSQMYTPGPAMSFLTCFCDFPQKEHLRSSPESPNLATSPSLPQALLDRTGRVDGVAGDDHVVDDAIFPGFVGRHHEVAIGVLVDALDRLTGVAGHDLVHQVA